MSSETDVGQVDLRKVTRTFRFDGYVQRGAEPYVDVYRETFYLDGSSNIVGSPSVTTSRIMWSTIAGRSWPLSDNSTVTAEQVYEALSKAFDEVA